jgi:hypothetical protein
MSAVLLSSSLVCSRPPHRPLRYFLRKLPQPRRNLPRPAQEEWPLLIIAPASLRLVWAEELEKWLPQLRPSSIHVIEGKEGRVAPHSLPLITVGCPASSSPFWASWQWVPSERAWVGMRWVMSKMVSAHSGLPTLDAHSPLPSLVL